MAHTLIGTVTSDQRDKTITVSITSRETHPLYRKQYTKTRKYTAHDADNAAKLGDRVQIAEVAPISKTKTYTLVKILERSHGTVELKEDVEQVQMPEKIGADQLAKVADAAGDALTEAIDEIVEETAEAQAEEIAKEEDTK